MIRPTIITIEEVNNRVSIMMIVHHANGESRSSLSIPYISKRDNKAQVIAKQIEDMLLDYQRDGTLDY